MYVLHVVLTYVKIRSKMSSSKIGFRNAVAVTASSVRLYSFNGLLRIHSMCMLRL